MRGAVRRTQPRTLSAVHGQGATERKHRQLDMGVTNLAAVS